MRSYCPVCLEEVGYCDCKVAKQHIVVLADKDVASWYNLKGLARRSEQVNRALRTFMLKQIAESKSKAPRGREDDEDKEWEAKQAELKEVGCPNCPGCHCDCD